MRVDIATSASGPISLNQTCPGDTSLIAAVRLRALDLLQPVSEAGRGLVLLRADRFVQLAPQGVDPLFLGQALLGARRAAAVMLLAAVDLQEERTDFLREGLVVVGASQPSALPELSKRDATLRTFLVGFLGGGLDDAA